MLDNLSLIHMNGRVQDPVLGRFVSADPHIPGRGNTQNFNRYSYVTNNPLSYLDPSGFCPEVATTDEDCDPTVTVTGHREPWVEDGASSAEQRLGPCQFFGGGYLSPLACQTVSAPIGMGTATADYMAAIHRQGMQEVVVCANCDRPNSTYDRGLIATDRWMDGSDLITTAAWLAILRRHYELYAQYPINAKIPSMLEQGYFVRVLSELRASKAYMDKLSKLGNILAWGGVSLGGLQLLEGHETENLDMQVDGLFNVGAGFATIFGGFAGAAFGVFEASGVRGWMMDAWDSAIDFQFETIRNMCGNDVACTDQAIYTFNPGMLISP
jgi:RHS repeat-associated protein